MQNSKKIVIYKYIYNSETCLIHSWKEVQYTHTICIEHLCNKSAKANASAAEFLLQIIDSFSLEKQTTYHSTKTIWNRDKWYVVTWLVSDYLSVNIRVGQEVLLYNPVHSNCLVFASFNILILKVNVTLCIIVVCQLAYTTWTWTWGNELYFINNGFKLVTQHISFNQGVLAHKVRSVKSIDLVLQVFKMSS